MMALLNLFSFFDYHFKRVLTIPTFAGHMDAFTLGSIGVQQRHTIPAHWAYNPLHFLSVHDGHL